METKLCIFYSIYRYLPKHRFLAAGMFLALFLPVVVCADSIELLELDNKPAEEIIPLIEPLLNEEDAVTGTGYQLILRTDKATLSQIRALLDKIDTRPKNLLISVRNSSHRTDSSHEIETSGRVTIGSQNRVNVNVHATDRSSSNDQDVIQKITVIEGGRAEIAAGESVPLRTRQVYQNGAWVTIHENIEYEDVGNSVYVRPSLQGDNVRLSIEPEYSSFDRQNGDIRYQSLDTVVIGKLGEWVSLGKIDENTSNDGSGILSTYRSSNTEVANIEVKVEIIGNSE